MILPEKIKQISPLLEQRFLAQLPFLKQEKRIWYLQKIP